MIRKMTFIGAGSMTEAIISGILAKGYIIPENIHVINKSNRERLTRLKSLFRVQSHQDKELAIKNAEVIVLSVKPKDVTAALQSIKPYVRPSQLIVSVIAGVSTEYISGALDSRAPVIRAMPNTSATIGFSATAIAGGRYTDSSHLELAKEIFATIGTVAVVKEADLHAVTGLSGSGPAYIYYLVEAMEKAAADVGLDESTAKDLIIQTLTGTAEMLKATGDNAAVLRKKVTSPGGTTQAGIEILQEYQYQEALIACIRRATARSKELGAVYDNQTSK